MTAPGRVMVSGIGAPACAVRERSPERATATPARRVPRTSAEGIYVAVPAIMRVLTGRTRHRADPFQPHRIRIGERVTFLGRPFVGALYDLWQRVTAYQDEVAVQAVEDQAVTLNSGHWCSPSLGATHGTVLRPSSRRRALPGHSGGSGYLASR